MTMTVAATKEAACKSIPATITASDSPFIGSS